MTEKKHPTVVTGYHGSIEQLAKEVCDMRYDKLAEFFQACSLDLKNQAVADANRGRNQLSQKLFRASQTCTELTFQTTAIFELCKPYMADEL